MGVAACHINGPALISVGEAGINGPLYQLGISEEGVSIVVNEYDEPIHTDKSGQHVPDTLQDFGQDALIRLKLIFYDLDVLNYVRSKRSPIGKDGHSTTRGGLVFSNDAKTMGMRVVITSQTDEPWRFFFCTPRGPRGGVVGTRKTVHDMSFYAIQRELPALGAGFWLYDHRQDGAQIIIPR